MLCGAKLYSLVVVCTGPSGVCTVTVCGSVEVGSSGVSGLEPSPACAAVAVSVKALVLRT